MIYYSKNCYNSQQIPSSKLQEIIAAITRKNGSRPKPTSRGFSMCCPAHNDRNPSFSITEASDGTILMKCFSRGCTINEICSAIGIKVSDLFPNKIRRTYRG